MKSLAIVSVAVAFFLLARNVSALVQVEKHIDTPEAPSVHQQIESVHTVDVLDENGDADPRLTVNNTLTKHSECDRGHKPDDIAKDMGIDFDFPLAEFGNEDLQLESSQHIVFECDGGLIQISHRGEVRLLGDQVFDHVRIKVF